MDFDAMLDEGVDLLRRRPRVTSRGLKRPFDLDDDALDRIRHRSFALMDRGRPMGHTCEAPLTS